MTFSVIVPYLNAVNYIEQCICSLGGQDFQTDEFELIFIDNGSSDGSSAIVERHPEIIHLKEETKGAYAARNRGLEIATGNIIAFTDADCVVSTAWLTEINKGLHIQVADIAVGLQMP